MPILKFILILLLLKVAYSAPHFNNDSSCPLWTVPTNINGSAESTCECGDSLHGVVYCDPNTLEISVLIYHCMTYNEATQEAYVGNCFFNYYTPVRYGSQKYMHRKLHTKNVSELNHEMCHSYRDLQNRTQQLFRTGQMCGSCEEGYAPPVYSYNLTCVECKDYKYNWLKYIAVAFLPLTVFYIIVVLFRITVTSKAMNGYILVSQMAMSPLLVRTLSIGRQKHASLFTAYTILYGIWNLEFFRDLYPPFCLHPKVNTLHVLTLDYLIAVYPLVLIVITYTFVKLHDRYIVVVKLWSPFYWCFSRIRKNWDITNSLIGAFATFLLLSYVKILHVSADILTPNALFNVRGNQTSKYFLYYDGRYTFFGKEHLPLALLAVFMLLVFNVIPFFLLALYPCRCFQKFLNCFWYRREVFRTFVETFNGAFRLSPHDRRCFAAFYLFLRFLNLITYLINPGPAFYAPAAIQLLFAAVIVAAARPYKSTFYSFMDAFFIALLGMGFLWEPIYSAIQTLEPVDLRNVSKALWLVLIPPLYGILSVIHYLFPKKYFIKIAECYKQIRQRPDSEEDFYYSPQTQIYVESSPLLDNEQMEHY